jgi:hypothetical protein
MNTRAVPANPPLLQAHSIHSTHAAVPHCIAPCIPELLGTRPLAIQKPMRDRLNTRRWLTQAPWRSRPLAGLHLSTVHCMQPYPNWRVSHKTAACAWTLPPPSSTQLAHTLARQKDYSSSEQESQSEDSSSEDASS